MKRLAAHILVAMALVVPALAVAATQPSLLGHANAGTAPMVPYIRLLAGLSLLSLIPAALVAMTSFTRIVVTLSFLRHALGMPETPPNVVLLTLALFLTFFTMQPVFERAFDEGAAPFLDGTAGAREAFAKSTEPFSVFMRAHVRDEDVMAVSRLAGVAVPDGPEAKVALRILVPSFMLSELRAAFVAGFVIFLPFVLIDLVVAAVLMALGMMMVPPVSISLPLKILLFVLVDGWSLVVQAVAGAYA